MFSGLSAFPLTPQSGGAVDLDSFETLVAAAADAGADSIGALGSTGSYAYLSRQDRAQVARAAVDAAGVAPVLVGVGAISTAGVLRNVEDAVAAGVAGVLLAPVSYQPLQDSEVYGLFEDVTGRFPDMPVVLYDNQATTGFTFTDDLRVEIAQLPSVVSLKLGTVPDVAALRARIPAHVSIGISGDANGARGLLAGCDVWYSVLGGVLPAECAEISRAAVAGNTDVALALSEKLSPVWELFARYGSYRVAAAIATITGLLKEDAVYAPVLPLAGANRDAVTSALRAIGALP